MKSPFGRRWKGSLTDIHRYSKCGYNLFPVFYQNGSPVSSGFHLTGDMDTDMRIGFNVGVGMEYQFSDMWSIQPSLMFTQKGAKQDEVKMNPMYLEIPVLAAARFAIADNQNIVVKAGPYFAFGIAGKCKIGDEKIDFFGDGDDQFGAKRFDAGLGVGVAYEINKFFIDLSGEFGLAKLADGDGAPKNMNFSIGVGYKF